MTPLRTFIILALLVALPSAADAQRRGLDRCIREVLRSEGGRVATVVADPTLSLRVEPSRDAPIMRSIPNGDPIVILGRGGGEWLRAIAVDATPGCIMSMGFVVSDFVR